jgi:hypothetical protein
MEQLNMDVVLLTEMKLTDDRHMRYSYGYNVFVTEGYVPPSRRCGAVLEEFGGLSGGRSFPAWPKCCQL